MTVSDEFYLVVLIKSIILPPGIILAGLVTCFFCGYKKRMFTWLFAILVFIFYLLSIPYVSKKIASIIEPEPLLGDKISHADAIVILGCNRYSKAPEFNYSDTVSACTLTRLRYAAILKKATGLPILVSGGHVFGENVSEAELMKRVLQNEFGVAVEWQEDVGRNTIENAKFSSIILKENEISSVLLVSHAIHILRAEYAFKRYDISVIAAPTYFYATESNKPLVLSFMPNIQAFYVSSVTLYEIIGYMWYRLRYAL